ncbi:hypothetical protein EV363DRAFT_1588278 [Boletus edulis]|nr:hypothetical protein EV363DRAFT_1588278 [Boletus edulis]
MALLAPARTTFRTTLSLWSARGYASTSSSKPSSSQPPKPASSEPSKTGTIMTGLNYLKGEPPILAKPDEEYPAWLWELTKPRQLMDDGPGGKAEKRGLRLTHRQTLKDNNMFKAK